jgi:carbamate kinase
MKVVVALGRSALLKRGESFDAERQRANLEHEAGAIAAIAREHSLVVTHGNSPQVGVLALQASSAGLAATPLDILDAESEGMIGYLIEQTIGNHLPGRQVVTLLTQVEVKRDDPAFGVPTKSIGPSYTDEQARLLARTRGWKLAPHGGEWRRVIPSPEPLRILELPAIRVLMEAGAVVICAGGGGIPVERFPSGAVRGVEAMIDKDLAASLLARDIEADVLLLLTDVDAVYQDWGGQKAKPIVRATPEQLRRLSFTPGSMAPKVEAACRFVEARRGIAAIGRVEDAVGLLEGRFGTQVRP